MPFRIILDERERHLALALRGRNVAFELRTLDLGDILITNAPLSSVIADPDVSSAASRLLGGSNVGGSKDEEKITAEPPITLVIERKSFTDLRGSLADGRYHNQKSRYLQLPRGTVFYLLEDNDPRFEKLDHAQFLGMYVHTVVRDQMGVFLTRSLDETAQFLIKLKATVEEFGLDYRDRIPSCGLEATQIKKKKIVGKDVYLQQLACFPGINKAKADLIAALYPSMSQLIQALRDGSFKVKGVGPVLTTGMKEGLFCSEGSTPDRLKPQVVFQGGVGSAK